MHFGVTNIILLHSDHRHVSATNVTIFRVERARMQIYLQCAGANPHLKIIQFELKCR
jgi:hypothetical protein